MGRRPPRRCGSRAQPASGQRSATKRKRRTTSSVPESRRRTATGQCVMRRDEAQAAHDLKRAGKLAAHGTAGVAVCCAVMDLLTGVWRIRESRGTIGFPFAILAGEETIALVAGRKEAEAILRARNDLRRLMTESRRHNQTFARLQRENIMLGQALDGLVTALRGKSPTELVIARQEAARAVRQWKQIREGG